MLELFHYLVQGKMVVTCFSLINNSTMLNILEDLVYCTTFSLAALLMDILTWFFSSSSSSPSEYLPSKWIESSVKLVFSQPPSLHYPHKTLSHKNLCEWKKNPGITLKASAVDASEIEADTIKTGPKIPRSFRKRTGTVLEISSSGKKDLTRTHFFSLSSKRWRLLA